MHSASKLSFNLLEFFSHALLHAVPKHDEIPISIQTADMGKTQKIKRIRFTPVSPPSILLRISTKLDQPRFVVVQRQVEPAESTPERFKKYLSVGAILEPKDDIISVPYYYYLSFCLPVPPLIGPQVKHIVEEDIGQ